MDNAVQTTEASPVRTGYTLSEKPKARSLSVSAVGNDGEVLGTLKIDMDDLPHWQEYFYMIAQASPKTSKLMLHFLAHAAASRPNVQHHGAP